ncbi:MAG: sugar phosphate nucleotidyltransferase [Oscillospiraceae bacterium]|nr:sugar phosphate nucleotidyltransferase [Oscillospiraceae bacterium]
MNKAPALVVLAAGMGSRYGGLKQIDPIAENGEVILDFSVYDALRAGFNEIILIIKKEIEADFEQAVGSRLRRQVDIKYAYQALNDIAPEFLVPPGRAKPWGTAHAVLAVKDMVSGPFAVINADDFYGAGAFRVMSEHLSIKKTEGIPEYCMVGYRLGNTLTDHGSVARGVCQVKNGFLSEIQEHTNIIKKDSGASFSTDGGVTWQPIDPDAPVSMQFFGFYPTFFPLCDRYFCDFLRSESTDTLKGECYLPWVVGQTIKNNESRVKVLQSDGNWFGVTHAKDKPAVIESIADLRRQGEYPPSLWG